MSIYKRPAAPGIPYTPTTPGDWDTPPGTVQEALDGAATAIAGAGGGGLQVVTLGPVASDSINSGGTASDDLDFALAEGVTRCLIVGCDVERTAGTSTGVAVRVFARDDRADAPAVEAGEGPVVVVGGSFGGATLLGDGTVQGPLVDISGGWWRVAVPYINVNGSEFVRARITETSGNDGTFAVTLRIIPL